MIRTSLPKAQAEAQPERYWNGGFRTGKSTNIDSCRFAAAALGEVQVPRGVYPERSQKQILRFAQNDKRRAQDDGSAVTFGRAEMLMDQFCFPGLAPGARFFRAFLRQAQGRPARPPAR